MAIRFDTGDTLQTARTGTTTTTRNAELADKRIQAATQQYGTGLQTTQARLQKDALTQATLDKGALPVYTNPNNLTLTQNTAGYAAPPVGGNTTTTTTDTNLTGGDDYTTTLTTSPPVVPPGPPPIALPDTAAFDASTLEAILASIEARYGLSKDQLLADESEVGRLYRFLQSNLAQQQAAAVASSQDEAVQRGILRSGIQLQREGAIENEFAQQKSFASAENAAKLEAIRRQLANLEAQQVAEQQAAAAYVGGGRLDTNRQLADMLQLAAGAGTPINATTPTAVGGVAAPGQRIYKGGQQPSII